MAWISSSDPDDANLPTTLLYPNVQRAVAKNGETALSVWLHHKNINIAGIPQKLLYKNCLTSITIKEWITRYPNTPMPLIIIKRSIGSKEFQRISEQPLLTEHEETQESVCCICFVEATDENPLLYPCENKHPDGGICSQCFLHLLTDTKKCPLCREKFTVK